jgi:hypothetical protein
VKTRIVPPERIWRTLEEIWQIRERRMSVLIRGYTVIEGAVFRSQQ